MEQHVNDLEHAVSLMLKSVELRQRHRLTEALEVLDEAAARNPHFLPCHIERAVLLGLMQRYEEAIDIFDRFLPLAPTSSQIKLLRDQTLQLAFAELEKKLALQANDSISLVQRGNMKMYAGLHESALEDYSLALALDPRHVDVLNRRGNVLLLLNRHHEAIHCYTEAVAIAPQRQDLWYNLGNAWQQLGQTDEARKAYQQAILIAPEFAEAHLEIAHCHLVEADFAGGWPIYEWRWQTAQLKNTVLHTDSPLWLGDAKLPDQHHHWKRSDNGSLSEKTLLVWAEQGAGDTIQFVRFIHLLATRVVAAGGKLILRVPQHLYTLLKTLDASVTVITDQVPLPAHDLHCPLMSLPLALGITDPPSVHAYLTSDPLLSLRWESLLGPRRHLRIGLTWAGLQRGPQQRSRDLALELLSPLSGLDVELFSLQKEITVSDMATLSTFPTLRCVGETFHDFADTAALIRHLDLVISVDTAVAHLASALGKPCWLLLRHAGEWRWLVHRNDSPWYPHMRIFRQPEFGNWQAVIAELVLKLTSSAVSASSP